MARILKKDGFGDSLCEFITSENVGVNKPLVWGTCSGLIMLANNVLNQKDGGQYHVSSLL